MLDSGSTHISAVVKVVLGPKVRTHQSTVLWTPLVESSLEDKVLALCSDFPMHSSTWYSAVVHRRDYATDNEPWFLQSAIDTSTLIVPATQRRTLGDCTFPVVAARAWNSLPSSVRDVVTSCLLTAAEDSTVQDVLWRGCWYLSHVAVSMWLFKFVRWPCNVFRDSPTLNIIVFNNNNNNKSCSRRYIC